jgi:hypothetical protein
MFVGVGHHNVMTGCLGLLDIGRGLQWPDGITKITQELSWPEVGEPEGGSPAASPTYHTSGALWSVRSPWPLGPEDFLVSAARTSDRDFALFVMDIPRQPRADLCRAEQRLVRTAAPPAHAAAGDPRSRGVAAGGRGAAGRGAVQPGRLFGRRGAARAARRSICA